MGDIKQLPEAVRSSVRSGIIMFDLTRVVEELVFNSLDAGATKISVAVGAGTCYVKVVDNGSGITRDGLVLLGERYATSKFDQLAVTDAFTRSFGFRGEAISSISDVSLLEIITKAHGRPNGYRKVMKGRKCLYFGIDGGRQDVGTIVNVRDLFYNQPVRRKHIQSSSKKVLQSVKKCVLTIALIHPKVLFKVVDADSDTELFCSSPSSSPLSLLMNCFGIEVSASLHEVNISDTVLKLSGYMSSPSGTSVKAFQYVYINSRYIHKGPIQKLLNQLSTRFNALDSQKADIGSQNAKESRFQTFASYILNLSCPRSWYDLTFEPSKTSVEFKDWLPIISFIEKAITCFWSEKFSNGDPLSHDSDMLGDTIWRKAENTSSLEEDFPVKYEVAKRSSRIHNHTVSFGPPSPQLEIQNEESDHISYQKENIFSSHNASEFERNQTGLGCAYQTDYSFRSCGGTVTPCRTTVNQQSGSYLQTPEDRFFGSKFFAAEKSNELDDCILGSSLEDEHDIVDAGISSDAKKVGKDLKRHFLRSCSSGRSLSLDGESLLTSEGFDFQIDGLRAKRKRLETADHFDVGAVDSDDKTLDFLRSTQWQYGPASVWSSPIPITTPNVLTSLDLSRDSVESSAIGGEKSTRENDLSLDSVAHFGKFASTPRYIDSDWSSVISETSFRTESHGVEQFIDFNAFERCIKYGINAGYEYIEESKDRLFHVDNTMRNGSSREKCSLPCWKNMCSDFKSLSHSEEDGCRFLLDSPMRNGSTPEKCSLPCWTNICSDFKIHGHSEEDGFRFYRERNLDYDLFPKYSDLCGDGPEWICSDSCDKYDGNGHAVTSNHFTSTYCNEDENLKHHMIFREHDNVGEKRSRRSHSAPPFYRGKKKFFTLNNQLAEEARLPKIHAIDEEALTSLDINELKQTQRSSGFSQLHAESNSVEEILICNRRPDKKKGPDTRRSEIQDISEGQHVYSMDSVEDFEDPLASELKWRKSCTKIADGDKFHNLHHEDTILDVSSGILHLAGESLVPQSISKNCLKDAKVLRQVDKKFIPIVGNGVLAIIDQHAADERIRLEELRQKVLSGENKTITYLDAEKKLVLPEIGYQLLYNYAEEIQNWGWVCNIHAPGSKSFTKNLNLLHKQPTVITLLAVPCILGVNLTDIDLLEFLQQLADTDGSSTTPPSVHRVLNSKACRGAIMFGDMLLPSECSLVVEELKRTSLCFQCAHGRPTTAPLVNLEALHSQIVKLGSWIGGSNELWHGLRRHELSLERAAHRLASASGQ